MRPRSSPSRSFAGRGPAERRDPPLHSRAHADARRACRPRRLGRRHAGRTRHPLPPALHVPGASAGDGEIVDSEGRAHRVDLLMVVPPHQAPEVVRSSPLLGVSGFVHVDPRTLQTDYDDVYAIGDVATIKLPTARRCPRRASSPTPRRRPWQSGSRTATAVRRPPPLRRPRLLLDRARRRQSRVRRRQLLCRARAPGQDPATGPALPLEQGGIREVVAAPLAVTGRLRRGASSPSPWAGR